MKKITKGEVYLVDSEPGDATRYQYLVYRDSPDNFTFAPTRSTFKFPQRLTYWDAKDIVDLWELNALLAHTFATELGCNVYTLVECSNTVVDIYEKHRGEK